MKKYCIMLALALAASIPASAFDFEMPNADGVTIYYDINSEDASVTVTYKDYLYNSYSGVVDVPASVAYDEKTYAVTYVGGYAFAGSSELTEVKLPETITFISNNAFAHCSGITEITIPDAVKLMGNDAFLACSSLVKVNLSPALVQISKNAFKNCSALADVNIPQSVTEISSRAFQNCTALEEIILPDCLFSLGSEAFMGCSGLKKVTIPASLRTVGGGAFDDCTALEEIKVCNPNPDDIILYNTVFANVPVAACTLFVPTGSKELYENADQWKDFANIVEFEPSGCSAIRADILDPGTPYFDLTGRPVSNPTPGLYIHKGRKLLVK